MRKLLSTLLLFISITSVSFAQQINELDFLSSGKWLVTSVQIGEEIERYSDNNNWMIFHTDGKYQIMMNNNQQNGNWKFEEATNIIQFDDDESFVNGLKIELLNDKELLFSAFKDNLVYAVKLKK
ncbi:hypothetical protein PG913_04845 [Tenacibaculum pacificus]|uniref:hypothetical protein n=1 Tax=Tenacibaculum TaxID=104267 RepID=UPI0022F402A0|nr:hypothetical protein [Tenacibaculum pacificus]WBX74521.1 hypothetical protein PG913_04845 [Tenacibaculum pacificus]